ncbi:MAG: 2-oxoacid ferredoxin oxidoreductase [Candidatus Kerfeldbacteria bacterium]|nr:2-oxoacid ferredoxin oxidoreductase [Candidatus Kerfeldbacteria bacterium]
MTIDPSTHRAETSNVPTWCPGCGNFALWSALNHVLAVTNIAPHQAAVVFDIGCSGNGANWVKAYCFHGLHGRAVPLATGIALANHRLKTIVISGDGAAYGEGLGHFLHAIRSNPDLTYIVENNQLYALTKGQASPTSAEGFKTVSTPTGVTDEPLNPIALAISADCSYVARGFAGDLPHLEGLIQGALAHRGFAFIDVFQPCVTFNRLNTFAWFYERIRKLDELGHDPSDRPSAWQRAVSANDDLPIGLFYRAERPTLQDRLPVLRPGPLVDQPLTVDLSRLYEGLS